jgi:hypothetical protein
MTNFSAFNDTYLKSLVEPFLPGGTPHITPIRFDAITPDIFAFLFRTTGRNEESHFLIALEYDYIQNIEEARDIITRWHGSFLDFWAPESNPKATIDLAAISVETDKYYKVILAEVEAPKSPSYWTDSKVLLPNGSVEGILESFPESKREGLKKGLEKIRHSHPEAAISIYLDDYGFQHFYYN